MGEKVVIYVGHNKGKRALKAVAKIVGKHFDGATISEAYGFFKGEFEPVVRVELLSTAPQGDNLKLRAKALGRELREVFKQNCVLLETTAVGISFE